MMIIVSLLVFLACYGAPTGDPVPEKVTSGRPYRLVVAGDVMVHQEQLNAALGTDGSYRFFPMLSRLKPLLDSAHAVWANLETVLWSRNRIYTGYPAFRSPVSLAVALRQVGFTGVWTANNHSFDWGITGMESTIRLLDSVGVNHCGTRAAPEEPDGFRAFSIGDSGTVQMANYTYGINGKLPDTLAWMIPFTDTTRMAADFRRLRDQTDPASGPTLVMVSLHWGQEYDSLPTPGQRQLARWLANQGAGLVVGHHPHVVQPIEWVRTSRGDSTLVIYSLGNLVSAQRTFPRAIGALVQLQLQPIAEKLTIHSYTVVPTWVENTPDSRYQVFPAHREAIANETNRWRKNRLQAARKHLTGIIDSTRIR